MTTIKPEHSLWDVDENFCSGGDGETALIEAQAQAICMQTADFERAYHAFVNKERPKFEGN